MAEGEADMRDSKASMASTPPRKELVFQAPLFRVRRGLKTSFAQGKVQPNAPETRGNPLAHALALGHRLRQAVDSGEAANFAEVAWRMGVSRAWVSMLVELSFLAPDLQEWILVNNLKGHRVRIPRLVGAAHQALWIAQRGFLGDAPLEAAPSPHRLHFL